MKPKKTSKKVKDSDEEAPKKSKKSKKVDGPTSSDEEKDAASNKSEKLKKKHKELEEQLKSLRDDFHKREENILAELKKLIDVLNPPVSLEIKENPDTGFHQFEKYVFHKPSESVIGKMDNGALVPLTKADVDHLDKKYDGNFKFWHVFENDQDKYEFPSKEEINKVMSKASKKEEVKITKTTDSDDETNDDGKDIVKEMEESINSAVDPSKNPTVNEEVFEKYYKVAYNKGGAVMKNTKNISENSKLDINTVEEISRGLPAYKQRFAKIVEKVESSEKQSKNTTFGTRKG